jgi:8-oxo-dGTP diphosphatase
MSVSSYIENIRRKIGHEPLLLPGVTAIIVNDKQEVLLQFSKEHVWRTIGGMLEPGEEPADAVRREVKEETALEIEIERVSGVYAWPRVVYANGDQCDFIAIAFRCRVTGGELRVNDDESLEFRYFPGDRLPDLRDVEVRCIQDALRDTERARY